MPSAFAIDQDTPIPPATKPTATRYPWTELKPGNSFFVPYTTTKRFSPIVWHAKKRTGFKFVTRAAKGEDPLTGETVDGVRVWRRM